MRHCNQELYTHEISKAIAKINEANTKFTKDAYTQMTKLKKFPIELETVINKFMLILGFKEKGWEAFKVNELVGAGLIKFLTDIGAG